MRSIATGAGVSVPTVESLFGTKARVLKAAIDVAIAGDDEPVAVLEREWATAAAKATDAGKFLHLVAEVLTAAQERSAGLVLAVLESWQASRPPPASPPASPPTSPPTSPPASSPDGELAALAGQLVRQREATATWITDRVMALGELRSDMSPPDAVDTIWLLMDPAVFVRLTRHRGWSPERYRDWIARSIRHLLLPDRVTPPGGTP
jgi:AcrR family transcriptional regulator